MTELTFADLDEIWEGAGTFDVQVLCSKAKASDFYFCALPSISVGVCWAVVPKDYFDKHHNMFDQTLPIDHLLPGDFFETMESVYEVDSERTTKQAYDDLISRGFIENKDIYNVY